QTISQDPFLDRGVSSGSISTLEKILITDSSLPEAARYCACARRIIAPKDAASAVVVVQLGAQYSPGLPCAARSHIEFRGQQHSKRRRCKVNPNGCPVRGG